MSTWKCLLGGCLFLSVGAAEASFQTYRTNVGQFSQPTYGNPSSPKRKTWWAKRLTNVGKNSERFYIGGHPSARDLKMLYEEGFSTVYSLFNFTEERMLGEQVLPTSAQAAGVAAEAGLLYGVWGNGSNGAWMSTEAVNHIESVLDEGLRLKGPIFLHCYIGRTACQAMQAYRARKRIIEKRAGESVTGAAMRECGAHGVRFHSKAFAEAIAREAGEDFEAIKDNLPLVPSAADWPDAAGQAPQGADGIWWKGGNRYGLSKYHWLKHVWKVTEATTVFDAGQIHRKHVKALKDANIGFVVNMRKSVASQEETNLLNIGAQPKQTEGRQNASFIASAAGRQHITDTNRTKSWVNGANGELNFESLNEEEFGDAGGYNEILERAAVMAAGLDYLHLPIARNYTADTLAAYAPQMIQMINKAVVQNKSILFHCRTGYRTGTFPTALRGVIEGTAPNKLQLEMSQIGYDFTQDGSGKTLLDETVKLKFCSTDSGGHFKGFVAKKDSDCSADAPTVNKTVNKAGTTKESTTQVLVSSSQRLCVRTLLAGVAALFASNLSG